MSAASANVNFYLASCPAATHSHIILTGMFSRYCSQNPDPNYNSCNVPQEMSNEAIDRELEGGSEVLRLELTHTAVHQPLLWYWSD